MATDPQPRDVLITGATGYIGRPLAERLAGRGHRIRSLARAASLARVGEQMIVALIAAIENPPAAGTQRVVDVPAIRRARLQ